MKEVAVIACAACMATGDRCPLLAEMKGNIKISVNKVKAVECAWS